MSDATAEHSLDIREQIVRIDRARAESEKFIAEQRKLIAVAFKFERDARVSRWQISVSVIGGAAGLIAALITALRAFGIGH